MSAEEYFDGRDPWEDDDGEGWNNYTYNSKVYKPKRYRCKYCNQEGLKWRDFCHGTYKLVSQLHSNVVHVCRGPSRSVV